MSDNNTQRSTANPKAPELTMITAVERSNGIGRAGDLPWSLKKEMKYFTRITKRVPPNSVSVMNAVIMGRKSWDALPAVVRPLPERINVIISRSPMAVWARIRKDGNNAERTHVVTSLEEGVELLHELYSSSTSGDSRNLMEGQGAVTLGRVFVIGGAEIYETALKMRQTVRLLLTRIYADFECDTFFPDFRHSTEYGKWYRQDQKKLEEWVGEDVDQGLVVENGVDYEFMLYERTAK